MSVITKHQVLRFLQTTSVMSVAVCDGDTPVSSILQFVIAEDFTLSFVTKENTRKVRALSKNPAISISVWEAGKMQVQSTGIATKIHDQVTRDDILEKIAHLAVTQSSLWPPILQYGRRDDYIVFSVSLKYVRVLDLQSDTISTKGESFTEIQLP